MVHSKQKLHPTLHVSATVESGQAEPDTFFIQQVQVLLRLTNVQSVAKKSDDVQLQ